MALSIQDKEEAHTSKDPGPPLPLPCMSGLMAALIAEIPATSWQSVTRGDTPWHAGEGAAYGTHAVQHPREGSNSQRDAYKANSLEE